ncbi:hypothetical protein TNCV_727801 [Trichonephila clavipes]|nr:hypothetical protein TNCV_727801 [Trichonephila clavipes]
MNTLEDNTPEHTSQSSCFQPQELKDLDQGWRTCAPDGTQHNILGTPPIKMVSILIQNNKIYEETLRTKASDRLRGWRLILQSKNIQLDLVSSKKLSKILKFIMYLYVTSFNKLNLS